MELKGYAGKILYVDLTTGKIKSELLDPKLAEDFIGGHGINVRLGYDLIKPGTVVVLDDVEYVDIVNHHPVFGSGDGRSPACRIESRQQWNVRVNHNGGAFRDFRQILFKPLNLVGTDDSKVLE